VQKRRVLYYNVVSKQRGYMQRNQTLDLLRGLTIILMIAFHFSFDLNHFKFVELDLRHDLFWRYFRKFIVASFVFIMGYTLVITYAKGIVWSKVFRRFRTIFSLALLITVATLFVFPKSYIYFGVLHFMAFATLIGVLFVRLPWWSLFLALVIFMGYNLDYLDMKAFMQWLKPILGLPKRSEDFVFFIPWLAPMFLGIFMAHFKLIPAWSLPKVLKPVEYLGQHSLLIYMIHQPIIFGTMLLLSKVI
jgi:uncharacterized membrane protein